MLIYDEFCFTRELAFRFRLYRLRIICSRLYWLESRTFATIERWLVVWDRWPVKGQKHERMIRVWKSGGIQQVVVPYSGRSKKRPLYYYFYSIWTEYNKHQDSPPTNTFTSTINKFDRVD